MFCFDHIWGLLQSIYLFLLSLCNTNNDHVANLSNLTLSTIIVRSLSIFDSVDSSIDNVSSAVSFQHHSLSPSALNIVVETVYRRGDVVDKFQLKERLDSLGSIKLYVKEDYKVTSTWDNKLYLTHAVGYHKLYLDENNGNVGFNSEVGHIDFLAGSAGHISKLADINGSGELILTDDNRGGSVLKDDDQSRGNATKHHYYLRDKLFLGGHGEIWRATMIIPPTSSSSSFGGNISADIDVGSDAGYTRSTGSDKADGTNYILKRMYVKDRPHILRCALREIYFGTMLQHDKLVAHFVTHFILDDDYWLVFRDEGVSLQQLLYAITKSTTDDSSTRNDDSSSRDDVIEDDNDNSDRGTYGTERRSSPIQYSVLEPSAIWMKLRTTTEGRQSIRSLMFKIITGVSNLHAQGIVHRDLKPSNILLNIDASLIDEQKDQFDSTAWEQDNSNSHARYPKHDHTTEVAKLVIADFSSAVNSEVLFDLHLFGVSGPSKDELTLQYTPPEVLFNVSNGGNDAGIGRKYSGNESYNQAEMTYGEAFDAWSIGVIFLEIILGTADVFSVDQRTSAMIAHRLRGYSAELIDQAMLLASFAEYCIYDGHSIHHGGSDDTSTTTSKVKVQSDALVEGTDREKGSKSSGYHYRDFLSKISSRKYHSSIHLPTSMNQEKKCGLQELSKAIQRRDPLGTGFAHNDDDENSETYAIDLISRLLEWNPSQRLPLHIALQHAYFVGPYISKHDGSPHPTLNELYRHDAEYLQVHKSRPVDEQTDTLDDIIQTHTLSLLTAPISRLMSRSVRHNDYDEDDGFKDSRFEEHIASRHHTANESWHRDHFTDETMQSIDLSINSTSIESTKVYTDLFKGDDDIMVFTCPKCGRKFVGDWGSCDRHVKGRKHGRRCIYGNVATGVASSSSSLPDCISHHAMLPIDEQSGWCDLKGRRKHMEDAHAIVFADRYKFFGIFDGHWGSRAAKFASRHIQALFDIALTHQCHSDFEDQATDTVQTAVNGAPLLDRSWSLDASPQWVAGYACNSSDEIILSQDGGSDSRFSQRRSLPEVGKDRNNSGSKSITLQSVMSALQMAFIATNDDFVSVHPGSENSGSTATVAILFDTNVIVANVGDSRAMLCCDADGRAFPLTLDHTPHHAAEYSRVIEQGGWIEDYGVLRVNGQLAITRSIGDKRFRSVLTSNPDVLVFRRHQHHHNNSLTAMIGIKNSSVSTSSCQTYHLLNQRSHHHNSNETEMESYPTQQFLVIASDGLWDVMTEQDVADFVCDHLGYRLSIPTNVTGRNHSPLLPIDAFHETAKLLAQEAYVRGSMDNIGVCLIDLY